MKNISRFFYLLIFVVFNDCYAQVSDNEIISADQIEKDLQIMPRTRQFVRVENEGSDGNTSSVSLSAITFEFDSDRLTDLAKNQLSELGIALSRKSLETKSFELIGHTDAKGDADYNLALSNRRALAVVNYLISSFGITAGSVTAYGKGEERLLNTNDPYASENRRVEVIAK